MNIATDSIFFLEKEFRKIYSQVFFDGFKALKQSRKIERYQVSLREVFGLCVLLSHRVFLDPDKKWAFTTESQISDDGAIIRLEGNQIKYCELIEQVYIVGAYNKRLENHSMNDHILTQLFKIKDKGLEYMKDTSLFILIDVQPLDKMDTFEWQDFAKRFFARLPFLHVYLLGLTEHTPSYNSYYLFSFTNQKHRQNLNGEFSFKINQNGISDFKCIQAINLLKKP